MRRWLVAVVGVGWALLSAPGTARAQTPPTRAFGTVTIDGNPAPAGTVVQAFIGDKLCGEGVVRRVSDQLPLGYVVDVAGFAQTEGCGVDSDTITFKVGGAKANETGTFATGSFLRLDLTVSGQVATPTPGPTPPPFGATASPAAGAGPGATATAAPSAAGGTPGASPTGSPQAGASPGASGSATASATPAATSTSGTVSTPLEPAKTDHGGSTNWGAILAIVVLIGAAAAGVGGYVWYQRGRAP